MIFNSYGDNYKFCVYKLKKSCQMIILEITKLKILIKEKCWLLNLKSILYCSVNFNLYTITSSLTTVHDYLCL